MPVLKFSHVVSFNSEDSPAFKAENLLQGKKWMCSDNPAIPAQLCAVLQLEKSSKIGQIDIGNANSAFVEVQVGKSAEKSDFKTILPAQSFMSPFESRDGQVKNRVRMFDKHKLSADVGNEEWDQVKIVCTQPFNKHVKYGISFVTMSGGQGEKNKDRTNLGAFKLKDESDEELEKVKMPIGSLFSKKKKEEEIRKVSNATEIKSEKTLATLALSQMDKDEKNESSSKKRPIFHQLKNQNHTRSPSQEDSSKKKLPRRDIVPGEEPTPLGGSKKRKSSESDTSSPSQNKNKKQKKTMENETRPFRKLFDRVVFTISGIQNPERGTLRQKVLDMGGKYMPDWSDNCTHLICAFANTPKFSLVKKKGGKIVRKDWINKSYSDKKRYPWRRFCLDAKDQGDESEPEIWDESLVPSASTTSRLAATADVQGEEEDEMDTDDEIEALKKEKEEEEEKRKKKKKTNTKSEYDVSTDEEETNDVKDEDSDEGAYDADTDIDDDTELQCDAKREDVDFPDLPDVFKRKNFFLYSKSFDENERKKLKRCIVAGNGTVSEDMGPKVDFVVAKKWNRDFDDTLTESNRDLKIVKSDFVTESFLSGALKSPSKYLLCR